VQPIKASRAARLQTLNQEREGLRKATQEYARLDSLGQVPEARLRSPFVALHALRQLPARPDPGEDETDELENERRRREIVTRPPLARLLHRRSNALALYLTAVYVAHLELKPGNAFTNTRSNGVGGRMAASWAVLSGMGTPAHPRAKRARMRRALDELAAAGLVSFGEVNGRKQYERWTLHTDAGTDATYRVPGENDSDVIVLPAAFFYYGWHLVLAPGEIAMLLAILHRNRQSGGTLDEEGRAWISLPHTARQGIYGLSDEQYLHVHELIEFGLVEFSEPMAARRRGKISPDRVPLPPLGAPEESDVARAQRIREQLIPIPYNFRPQVPKVFDRDAFTVVHDALSHLPLPYRLDDNNVFATPEELVNMYRGTK
jgi:hypothetical protein